MIALVLAVLLAAPVEPPPQADVAPEAPSLPEKVMTPHVAIHDKISREDVERYVDSITRALEDDQKRVVITLDTPGGSVYLAHQLVKLMDAARNDHGIRTDCVVDGRAWSSGLYILQACDRRYMTKRSTIVAHAPLVENDMPVSIAELQDGSLLRRAEVVARAFAEQCAGRMTVPISSYMSKIEGIRQWWMDWREALAVGAVDRVVNKETDVWTTYADTEVRP